MRTRDARAHPLRRLAAAVAVLAGLACALMVVATLRPVLHEVVLAPTDLHPLRGHAYATVVPPPPGAPLLAVRGDDHGVVRSRLVLLEDGRPLPMPHAPQPAVERAGAGRYLHLRASELYFSTPDGTDPRTNGRRYTVRVPAVPAPALLAATFAAFVLAGSLWACWPSRGRTRSVPHPAALAGGALLLASAWLAATWGPAPLVVDTGDGGNVASIAAGWMHRERLADDPVFGSASNSTIYVAASVPATMALARVTGDIGQGYLLVIWPILLLQLWGFFRLGVRLFDDRGAAVALALLSVPPVYVFNGEVWGMLAMPLTRAVYGAAFPWLLLLTFSRTSAPSHAAVTMAACGAAIYLHPPSAPVVALACWLALLATPAPGVGRAAHLRRMALAAAVFVACTVPFALAYVSSFPSGAREAGDGARALAAEALAARTGPQYYDVREALRQLAGGGANASHNAWGWRWVLWAAGLAAFWWVPRRVASSAADARRARWLLAGVMLGSAGVAALDQAIAASLGRRPVQIDLVRGLRFVVPLLLLGAVWAVAAASRDLAAGPARAAVRAVLPLLCVAWWWSYPTPLAARIATALTGEQPVRRREAAHDRAILARLAAMPPNRSVLPLPLPRPEGSTELVGLAVRYGALQPVAFLQKDINLLGYSSSPQVAGWLRTEAALVRAEAAADAALAAGELRDAIAGRRVDLILLQADEAPAPLAEAIAGLGREIAREGPWRLFALEGARP